MSVIENHKCVRLRNAETILIRTGNTVKRGFGQTPTEELEMCLNCVFDIWMASKDNNHNNEIKDVVCYVEKPEELNKDERNEYKITVKIFIGSSGGEDISESINKAMEEMGVSSVETVILSVVPDERNKENLMTRLKPLWSSLEKFVGLGLVYTLGVSDLNKSQLEELYDWAEVKPAINQVNLENCCTIPQELMEYAKVKDIQLLTHSDPFDILPKQTFNNILKTKLNGSASTSVSPLPEPMPCCVWLPSWVVKYSALIKCRGIIHSKGYIVKLKREK